MKLCKEAIQSGAIRIPENVRYNPCESPPEKVIQFGEGNFLRAFINWMFSRLIDEKMFDGSIVVVQPIPTGRVDLLNSQDGLSTLVMRGYKDGAPVEEIEIVKGISRGINPYAHWDEVLQCAENPGITYVLSNTTEAGIAFDPQDSFGAEPPNSFPGKIVAYLYRRYHFFKGDPTKGLIFLPCELNDRNGDLLKATVLRLAVHWNMEPDFIQWVEESNSFLNTLVDRTVPGYPKDEAALIEDKLGYEDGLLNVSEMFHQWIIEDPMSLTEKFPFEKAGLNVKRVTDITPYRSQKVRILNGGHTSSVPAAFMYGLDTVDEMMRHEVMGKYVRKAIYDEIIPALDGNPCELKEFADDVVRRFKNPLIRHYLSSILLNSIFKYTARVIDSIIQYCEKYDKAPQLLSFSYAALIALYRSGEIAGNIVTFTHNDVKISIQDDMQSLAFFTLLWRDYVEGNIDIKTLTAKVLSNQELWGIDMSTLCGLSDKVAEGLANILNYGWVNAVNRLMGSGSNK